MTRSNSPWQKIDTPAVVAAIGDGIAAYQREAPDGILSVFVGQETPGWHLSISHRIGARPGRYPSWDEIVEARYRFCPQDVTMAMVLPPIHEYVNVHPTTFHLWEWRDGPEE